MTGFQGVDDALSARISAFFSNAGAGQETSSQTNMLNGLALPVINISRQFNVSYENNAEGTSSVSPGQWRDSEGKPLADMMQQYAVLTYDVTLIASERETLALMCNAMGASIFISSKKYFTHQPCGSGLPAAAAATTITKIMNKSL